MSWTTTSYGQKFTTEAILPLLFLFVFTCLVPPQSGWPVSTVVCSLLHRPRHWQDAGRPGLCLRVTVAAYPLLVKLLCWCLSYPSVDQRNDVYLPPQALAGHMDKKCSVWVQYSFSSKALEMQALGGPLAFTPLKQNMPKLAFQTTRLSRAWSLFWKIRNR